MPIAPMYLRIAPNMTRTTRKLDTRNIGGICRHIGAFRRARNFRSEYLHNINNLLFLEAQIATHSH